MAVNTLAQLPFNTVHMHDEVGGEDNSTVINVNVFLSQIIMLFSVLAIPLK